MAGLPPNASANLVYKQSYQKRHFTRLLGTEALSRRYIRIGKSYLARGHLTPVADFQYAAWQFSSFYYINTTPQWQSINAGNWKNIENEIREFSKNRPSALKVYTGTYGDTLLENHNGFPVTIFLAHHKFPVSLYLWKIIYCEIEKRAIVFVVLNHPFVPFVTKRDYICPNICHKYGWDSEKWKRLDKGYLICCNYHQFKHVVPYPQLVVKGILRRTDSFNREGKVQNPR